MPYTSIVCLVGESPLPVLLGVLQFAADPCTVVLAHSVTTEPQAGRIKRKVEQIAGTLGGNWACALEPLVDPYDPSQVTADAERIHAAYPGSALNFTGGTKVMSAFSVRVWLDAEDPVFYLEDAPAGGNSRFRLQNGERVEFDLPYQLTAVDLCDLHDVEPARPGRTVPCTAADVQNIAARWLELKREGRDWILPADSRGIREFWTTEDLELQTANGETWTAFLNLLTPDTRPQWNQHIGGRYGDAAKRQAEFAAAKWLEEYVAHLVAQATKGKPYGAIGPAAAGFEAARHFNTAAGQFESDGLLVVNNRLFYFSVTTSAKERECKEKAIEAAHRARQIGGPAASACLISAADPQVAESCHAALGRNPRHRIFGMADIQSWHEGDLNSLAGFLQ